MITTTYTQKDNVRSLVDLATHRLRVGVVVLLACATLVTSHTYAQLIPVALNADADGFDVWTQVFEGEGTSRGDFIGASGTGLDVNENSWGLFANASSGDSSGVSRIYQFGGELGVDHYVEIGVSLGWIDTFSVVGFSLRNSDGVNRFEAYFTGGNSVWSINDGSERDITGPSTTFGDTSWHENNYVTFRFTQLANDTYRFSVNGTDITNSDLNLTASDIDRIRIFNWNAGEGENHNQYFNNLNVVPEPGSLMLTLLGLSTMALLRKRQKRAKL